MYNGKAYVNASNRQVPIFEVDEYGTDITNNQIGWLYPSECFGCHVGEGNTDFITFRNSAGVTEVGGLGSIKPDFTLYGKKKSNGTSLVNNTADISGFYTHTLAKDMNWYIGEIRQSVPLPTGTQVKIRECTTGAKHYYRIACSKAKKPGETSFKELNPGGEFWVDFLSLGTMPYNRAIL